MKTQIKGFIPTPVEIGTLAAGDFYSYGLERESGVYICAELPSPTSGRGCRASCFRLGGRLIEEAVDTLVYKLVPPDEIEFALA